MYYNENPVKAAEELVKLFPEGHDWVVHFVNSGSEAVDLACLQARAYT
jgi:alanine-glyoxylate transaminase / (R)-3-amino-2-methylpropionate-pyruvate transaminase